MTAYRTIVLEHFRRPKNRRPLESANAAADGANPLCGDRIRIQLEIDGDVVRQAAFTADACALCIASASVLTEHVRGMRVSDAVLVDASVIHESLDGVPPAARIKCSTLPLDTLRRAVQSFRGASSKV